MATLEQLNGRFSGVKRPSDLGVNELWESPYRLLGGALYSIQRAITSKSRATVSMPKPLPKNWVDLLTKHTTHGENFGPDNEWIHIWAASYMFTNATFRIASATEKVAGLAAGEPGNGRKVIGNLKDPNKPISLGLEAAHQFLKDLPPSDLYAEIKRRAALLAECRANFPKPFPPLICAIIQADNDKHQPEDPRKDLHFDCALAMESFLEGCAVFDQAIGQASRECA